jgi:DNA-binding transcriptional regulator/RsmH inhibitor MraZ
MSTPWTDHEAAVEEGHYIQTKLKQAAYLVCDTKQNLYVFTHEEYKAFKKKLYVLEIFHPGGRYGHKRLLSKHT